MKTPEARVDGLLRINPMIDNTIAEAVALALHTLHGKEMPRRGSKARAEIINDMERALQPVADELERRAVRRAALRLEPRR